MGHIDVRVGEWKRMVGEGVLFARDIQDEIGIAVLIPDKQIAYLGRSLQTTPGSPFRTLLESFLTDVETKQQLKSSMVWLTGVAMPQTTSPENKSVREARILRSRVLGSLAVAGISSDEVSERWCRQGEAADLTLSIKKGTFHTDLSKKSGPKP